MVRATEMVPSIPMAERAMPYIPAWETAMMTVAAIKNAQRIGFPTDHMIGNWWASSTEDMIAAGDSERAVAPLKPAADAIVLDSTALGIEAVLKAVIEAAKKTQHLHSFANILSV